jgi:hypothetical protein
MDFIRVRRRVIGDSLLVARLGNRGGSSREPIASARQYAQDKHERGHVCRSAGAPREGAERFVSRCSNPLSLTSCS